MRLTVAVLVLLSLSALSGCMTSMALVTSPDIAKLKKEADRYMVMETDVEIEGKLNTIKVGWRCFQSPSFSANAGWYMRWQGDPEVAYAAKALPSGRYLIMGMGGIYCSTHGSEFEHGQNVGLLDPASSTLYLLVNQEYKKPHDPRIKRNIIRAMSAPEKVENTADELKVADRFLKENPSYATVFINYWDAAVWEGDPVVKARVTPLTALSFASDLHYQMQEGPNKVSVFGDFKDYKNFMRLPVINGRLDLDKIDLGKAGDRIFGWTADTDRNSTKFEVCYVGQCRKVNLGSGERDQIYDPATRRIIQFTWPVRSIGRNLNQLLE